MKSALLFSSGKDSCLAGYLAKQQGHQLACLITIISQNQDSYMFHTPSITQTKKQAKAMNLPLITQKTKGEKEIELQDLEKAIIQAKTKYKIQALITGAIQSQYQKSRIEKICKKLNIKPINPLWQKSQFEVLEQIIKNKFNVIITGVAAYPLDASWLGKKINKKFLNKATILNKKYQINPAGEGGEFETFTLDCPLFNYPLKITKKNIKGEGHSWKLEIKVEPK